jgi:ribosomal protein S27AE
MCNLYSMTSNAEAKLQRALPDGALRIVARGEKQDGAWPRSERAGCKKAPPITLAGQEARRTGGQARGDTLTKNDYRCETRSRYPAFRRPVAAVGFLAGSFAASLPLPDPLMGRSNSRTPTICAHMAPPPTISGSRAVVRGRWKNNRAENSHQPTRQGSARCSASRARAQHKDFCPLTPPSSLSSHGDERVACGRCDRLKLSETEAFRALGSTT